MSKPVLLTTHLTGKKLTKISLACMKLGISLQQIDDSFAATALEDIIAGKSAAPTAGDETKIGEMLVFSNFSSKDLDKFLAAVRQARLYIPVKAIVTPTNLHWTLSELYREVSGEAAAMRQGERLHQQEENKD